MERQLPLFDELRIGQRVRKPDRTRGNGVANRLDESDRPFHGWYRFVLSFPPHLVRDYIERFDLKPNQQILDPFCGTGTTLIEAKLNRLRATGMESNPIAHFASATKTDWSVSARRLKVEAPRIALEAERAISRARKLRTLPAEGMSLLLTHSICPVPLHKSLLLLDTIDGNCPPALKGHARLAFAKTLVGAASNLHFGPEVGVRGRKEDADVVGAWLQNTLSMVSDIESTQGANLQNVAVYLGDSREPEAILRPESIDAIFTSPPYPNEKDYTRATRLELVTLGFIRNKHELRQLKRGLLRSNTRGVYTEDSDDIWIKGNTKILRIAAEIEHRRIELGKTSGFERLYARVTKLYFGGMSRHLAAMRPYLRKGAHLAYVVGDQASYLRVLIKTGELLAEIAESLGYLVDGIDLFRTRLATATRAQIREEIVVLRWPGTTL